MKLRSYDMQLTILDILALASVDWPQLAAGSLRGEPDRKLQTALSRLCVNKRRSSDALALYVANPTQHERN